MKPLTLFGLGINENRAFFILSKEDLFKEYFNEILKKLDFSNFIYEEQGIVSGRENELDHFKNKNFDIDLLYTRDRIFVLVRANKSNLEEFKKIILAYSKIEEN